jgi:hypothetical protein
VRKVDELPAKKSALSGSSSLSWQATPKETATTKAVDFESIYLTENESLASLSAKASDELCEMAQSRLVNLPPKSMADLLNKTNDFQTTSNNQVATPVLAYLFGLCKFVTITPTRSGNYIDSESRAKVVLSSISIAINNTGWLVESCVYRKVTKFKFH